MSEPSSGEPRSGERPGELPPELPPEPGDEGAVSDFGISLPRGRQVLPRRPEYPGGVSAAEAPDPRFAVAEAVRRISTALVGRPVPDAELAAAAGELRTLADRLEASAGPGRRPRSQPEPTGPPQDFFPTSPVIGFANPVSPPVLVEVAPDGGLRGSAFFDYQYEGPPTCVHGGVIALVFDELLGAANIAAGCPGMTGTLTVRYRSPTPLRTPLRLEARITGHEGRKVTTWGGIFRADELLAEAEGIFIELAPERFLRMVGATLPAGDAEPRGETEPTGNAEPTGEAGPTSRSRADLGGLAEVPAPPAP